MMQRHVVLLRTPSSPLETDSYQVELSSRVARLTHVDTLVTHFVHQQDLDKLVSRGADGFDGVIITSKRAAQAWNASLERTAGQTGDWQRLPYFVVGQPTRAELLSHGNYADVRGQVSGTGERLAHFILEQPDRPSKLLYLVGDKNRDTIESILREAGIALVRQQVYETSLDPNFEKQLLKALDDTRYDETWIVFFAPSVTDAAFTALKANNVDLAKLKLATIGSVTTTHIRDAHHMSIDAEADSPDPRGLLASLQSSFNSNFETSKILSNGSA